MTAVPTTDSRYAGVERYLCFGRYYSSEFCR